MLGDTIPPAPAPRGIGGVLPAASQVDEFADSAVLVRLIFWVASPRDQWRVASEVRQAILRRFREEGIEIPFPQRVLWTRERARIEAEPGA